MPTFEIQLDDGRKFHVDAVDQKAALAGIQQHVGQQEPEKGGLLDAAKQGVAGLAKGFGNTAEVLGADGVGKALNNAGDAVTPTNHADTTLYDDKGFHAENIGNAIAENAPSVAAALTAARLAPGGLIGKLIAAGVVGAGAAFGNNAKDAALKRTGDANAPTNSEDLGHAALRTLPEAAINSLPIGRIAGAPLAKLGLKGVAGSLGRTALDAAGMGAANAGSNVYDQSLENGTVDPTQAINAGVTGGLTGLAAGAGRTATDIKAAVKYRALAGEDPAHVREAANRIQDANDNLDGSLGNTGDGYTALRSAQSDVGNEFNNTAKSLYSKTLGQEPLNILARAKAGVPLSDSDAATLDAATNNTQGVQDLQRLAGVQRSLKAFGDTGNVNDQSGTFKGGFSSTMENHIRGLVNPTSAIAGTAIASMGGSHLLAYSPHALATLGGAYGLSRLMDFASGARSPVKDIVNRFAQDVPTPPIQPTAQPVGSGTGAANLAQQAANITGRPGPTGPGMSGPKPSPWTFPPQAPQPAPPQQPNISPVAMAMLKKQMANPPQAPAQPAQPPATPPLNLSPVAMAMLKKQFANPPQAPAQPAPAPETPPQMPNISPVAMKMLAQQFKNPPQAPAPQAQPAPAAPEMPQLSPIAMKMLLQKLKSPPQAPVAPAQAAPVAPTAVPPETGSPTVAPAVAPSQAAPAPATAPPPATPTKITKSEKSGVKVDMPKPVAPVVPEPTAAPTADAGDIPDFLRMDQATRRAAWDQLKAPQAPPEEAPALAKQALSKLNGAPKLDYTPDQPHTAEELAMSPKEFAAQAVASQRDEPFLKNLEARGKLDAYIKGTEERRTWKGNTADALANLTGEPRAEIFHKLMGTHRSQPIRDMRDALAAKYPDHAGEIQALLGNKTLSKVWNRVK